MGVFALKINPNQASGLYEAYRKSTSAKARPEEATATAAGKGDKVELSDEAKRLQSLRSQLAALPDAARAERVEALHRQVQAGTYRVDESALADRLSASGVLGTLK